MRPPCGSKPGKVKATDVRTQKDGLVVHKPSGYAIGHVEKNPDGPGYVAHHVDGKKTEQRSKAGAEMDVVLHHNRVSKKVQAGDGSTGKPEPEAKSSMPAAREKPAARPAAVKPAVAEKPAAKAPAQKPVSTTTGKPRSGDAVWKTSEGTASLTDSQKKAIANAWYSKNFINTQDLLRNGHLSFGAYWGIGTRDDADKYKADVATFSKAIGEAKPFSSDAELYRGLEDASTAFGAPGSTVGKVVRDKGFVSTTSNTGVAKSYTAGYGKGSKKALVVVHAPAGSRAMKVDPDVWRLSRPKKGQTPPEVLQEYTFAPNTAFKVLSDAVADNGARVIHVEAQ